MAILIIDDDRSLCETTKVLLEDEYKVFTAFSGAEGLYLLCKESISLILLDYGLPDMDGISVLKNIKELHRIPVIMITGIGDKEIVLKSWQHKADYYFDKPFRIGDLKAKISELLKKTNEAVHFKVLNLDPSVLSSDIRKSLEFIMLNISSQNTEKLTLEEISRVTSVSPKYLSDLFRKECGQNIYQIITALKIEKTKELINKGKDVKEIAHALGYNHPNNLYRFIKSATGKSLSELK